MNCTECIAKFTENNEVISALYGDEEAQLDLWIELSRKCGGTGSCMMALKLLAGEEDFELED